MPAVPNMTPPPRGQRSSACSTRPGRPPGRSTARSSKPNASRGTQSPRGRPGRRGWARWMSCSRSCAHDPRPGRSVLEGWKIVGQHPAGREPASSGSPGEVRLVVVAAGVRRPPRSRGRRRAGASAAPGRSERRGPPASAKAELAGEAAAEVLARPPHLRASSATGSVPADADNSSQERRERRLDGSPVARRRAVVADREAIGPAPARAGAAPTARRRPPHQSSSSSERFQSARAGSRRARGSRAGSARTRRPPGCRRGRSAPATPAAPDHRPVCVGAWAGRSARQRRSRARCWR